ncbi:hypothetical protein M2447_000167 [Ereboglobus sp. PH5-10]|uniref:DUF4304 domain-containing protein n=1 Tax=Ereboglobus sp. PH5-10 TaxID=2940629 RepID=UPI0024054C8F|nr:DUF4304 domain-containing protein [Ereboglobus sp. PH5-10]MDF9826091.1 hypothetical protein [Ereboglobus sp. PH5-10]
MPDNTSAPPPASKSYAPGDINSLIRDIGSAKSAAARARFAGRPPDAQDTRAVYLETCAAIAAAFEPRGYKFSKSGPHFTAKSRDKQFTYRISFQSSHNNIPGQHIRLLVHTSISSPVVKKWETALWARHGRTYQGNGSIAGTQLGYLAEPGKRAWVAWELAHEHTRAAAIAEVTDRITRHALPWFAQCEDIPRLVGRIVETGVFPDCHVEDFPAELLLCFASRGQTARALASYIKTLHPKARANLHKDLAAARAESPLEINYSGFSGCHIRYLLAEGIEFPKE